MNLGMRKKLSATFSFVEIFSLDRRQVCVRELVAKELEQCGGVFTRCIRHDNLVNKKQNSKVRKNKQTSNNKNETRLHEVKSGSKTRQCNAYWYIRSTHSLFLH